MPQYQVRTGGGQVIWGPGAWSAANTRAKEWSASYADRWHIYWVEEVPTSEAPGRKVSVWLRGMKCNPEQMPRAEVHKGSEITARVPVVADPGGNPDETWSLQAGELIRRITRADQVRLVLSLTQYVARVTGRDEPLELAAESPSAAVMAVLTAEIGAGNTSARVRSLGYVQEGTGNVIEVAAQVLAAIPGTVTGPRLPALLQLQSGAP